MLETVKTIIGLLKVLIGIPQQTDLEVYDATAGNKTFNAGDVTGKSGFGVLISHPGLTGGAPTFQLIGVIGGVDVAIGAAVAGSGESTYLSAVDQSFTGLKVAYVQAAASGGTINSIDLTVN